MNKVSFERELCKGCNLCASVCPKKIIKFDNNEINKKGYHPATVSDMSACLGCAMCAVMCPDSVITVEKEDK